MALFHVMNSMRNDISAVAGLCRARMTGKLLLRDRACGAQMGGQVVDAEYDVSPPTWAKARDRAGCQT